MRCVYTLLVLMAHHCASGFAPRKLTSSVLFRQNSLPTKLFVERVSIEYCTGCRWMLRSAWMAQELLTTFQDELGSVTLVPSRVKPGGVFTVRCNNQILWDRKEQGGFPESKELKQRVRDLIAPEQFLGHSDSDGRLVAAVTTANDCEDCPTPPTAGTAFVDYVAPEPHVAITYCTGCRWLLRCAWFAQEMLTTFDSELNAVTLIPSRPSDSVKGGTFVQLNGELLWDRTSEGRFPEIKELKQLVRNRISPTRDLGHSDNKGETLVEMDDDEADRMRKFFGVM